jgi:hypothetical protein
MVSHPAGFIHGQFKDLLGRRGEVHTRHTGAFVPGGQALHDLLNLILAQPHFAQNPACHAAFFAHQAEQQMLGANMAVLHPFGFFLGQAQDTASALREALHLV